MEINMSGSAGFQLLFSFMIVGLDRQMKGLFTVYLIKKN